MKRLIFVSLSALALTGCTGSHLKRLAVCDGKHRRPANIYGSILPTLPVPVPPSEAGGRQSDSTMPSPALAAPAMPPHQTSLREAPAYFASC